LWLGRCGRSGWLDGGDRIATLDRVAFFSQLLDQDASRWCRDLQNDFVGLYFRQRLVGLYCVAGLFVPKDQSSFGD
jgi:hypothetical protein